jgi:hypothetical protein
MHNLKQLQARNLKFAHAVKLGGSFDFSKIFETIKALFSSIGPMLTDTIANSNPYYSGPRLQTRGNNVLYQ